MDQTLAHQFAIAGATWDCAMPELTSTVPYDMKMQFKLNLFDFRIWILIVKPRPLYYYYYFYFRYIQIYREPGS